MTKKEPTSVPPERRADMKAAVVDDSLESGPNLDAFRDEMQKWRAKTRTR